MKKPIAIAVLVAVAIVVAYLAGREGSRREGDTRAAVAGVKPAAGAVTVVSPGARVEGTPDSLGTPRASAVATTSTRPLPPLDAPVAAFLPELKQRALAGDARAACRLAFELPRCYSRTAKADFVKMFRTRAADTTRSEQARERSALQAAKYEDRAAKDEAACKGVDANEYFDTWKYALLAANGGDLETAVRFAAFPFAMGLRLNSPAGQLDGWAAWRESAAGFILRGVEAGMPAAVEAAAFNYVNANLGYAVFEKDPVRALAYRMALAQYAHPNYRRIADDNAAYIAKEYDVSEADRARARALSLEIAAKMAKAGRVPGEVDFGEGTYANTDAGHCN